MPREVASAHAQSAMVGGPGQSPERVACAEMVNDHWLLEKRSGEAANASNQARKRRPSD